MDAGPFVPDTDSLKVLREAANSCRGCPLYGPATQAVFGEGPRRARLMMVGEMPGDREDRAGHVFVGPAGREFDAALERAGIARSDAYVTNVAKHFKFRERGKRRIHDTPKKSEVDACLPWLREELRLVKPQVVLFLGATAAKALLGPKFRVTKQRGEFVEPDFAPLATATVHPSSILRIADEAERREARRAFVRDLRRVAKRLHA
jgi:uracil-DNA glycosylase